GLFTFIGATTENPSFEVNSALLSRARVYVLQPLSADELRTLVDRAITVYNEIESGTVTDAPPGTAAVVPGSSTAGAPASGVAKGAATAGADAAELAGLGQSAAPDAAKALTFDE